MRCQFTTPTFRQAILHILSAAGCSRTDISFWIFSKVFTRCKQKSARYYKCDERCNDNAAESTTFQILTDTHTDTKKSPCKGRLFENGSCQRLQYFDGAGSRAAAVIIDFIADALSFVQLAQAFFFQFRNMDKYILAAVFRLNKAITFTWIKPFNSSCCHIISYLQ